MAEHWRDGKRVGAPPPLGNTHDSPPKRGPTSLSVSTREPKITWCRGSSPPAPLPTSQTRADRPPRTPVQPQRTKLVAPQTAPAAADDWEDPFYDSPKAPPGPPPPTPARRAVPDSPADAFFEGLMGTPEETHSSPSSMTSSRSSGGGGFLGGLRAGRSSLRREQAVPLSSITDEGGRAVDEWLSRELAQAESAAPTQSPARAPAAYGTITSLSSPAATQPSPTRAPPAYGTITELLCSPETETVAPGGGGAVDDDDAAPPPEDDSPLVRKVARRLLEQKGAPDSAHEARARRVLRLTEPPSPQQQQQGHHETAEAVAEAVLFSSQAKTAAREEMVAGRRTRAEVRELAHRVSSLETTAVDMAPGRVANLAADKCWERAREWQRKVIDETRGENTLALRALSSRVANSEARHAALADSCLPGGALAERVASHVTARVTAEVTAHVTKDVSAKVAAAALAAAGTRRADDARIEKKATKAAERVMSWHARHMGAAEEASPPPRSPAAEDEVSVSSPGSTASSASSIAPWSSSRKATLPSGQVIRRRSRRRPPSARHRAPRGGGGGGGGGDWFGTIARALASAYDAAEAETEQLDGAPDSPLSRHPSPFVRRVHQESVDQARRQQRREEAEKPEAAPGREAEKPEAARAAAAGDDQPPAPARAEAPPRPVEERRRRRAERALERRLEIPPVASQFVAAVCAVAVVLSIFTSGVDVERVF